MGLLEFSKLPVNTLVGADWKTFKEMTRGQEIAPDKRTKYYLTKKRMQAVEFVGTYPRPQV